MREQGARPALSQSCQGLRDEVELATWLCAAPGLAGALLSRHCGLPVAIQRPRGRGVGHGPGQAMAAVPSI